MEQYRILLHHPDGSTSTPDEVQAEALHWLGATLESDAQTVLAFTQDTIKENPRAATRCGDLLEYPSQPEPGVTVEQWTIELMSYAEMILYTIEGIKSYAAYAYPASEWSR